MSKDIKERAREFAYKQCSHGRSEELMSFRFDIRTGYIAGAEDQRIIDEIELKPRWISVDDRLPDGETEVIVCTEEHRQYVAYYDSSIEEWWLGYDESCDTIFGVTHWMPLPELPSK